MGLRRLTRGLFKKLALLHNLIVLAGWIYVEFLIVVHFYSRLHRGFKLDFSLLHTLDLWHHVGWELKCLTLFSALNLLFLLDSRRDRNAFLSLLLHHSKACLMYFVTLKLLEDEESLRWPLVNLALWTLLNLLDCLNRFNLYMEHKNEFFEWVYYKSFIFLYPLLTLSELVLVTSSYGGLHRFDGLRSFPSPMPNRLNFSFNLHLLYKLAPAPILVCSVLEYLNKCKYN